MAQWKTIAPTKLNEMISANMPIYILNTSMHTSGRMAVIISFIDGTRRRQFVVPPTFIPICITDAIPHKEISNPDFLDLLNKNVITIVDSVQAQEFLKTPEAREEFHAITLSEHSARAQGVNLETGVKRSFSSTAVLTADVEEAVSDVQISTKVRAFMDELVAGAITAKQALSECKRHSGSFSELDFHYIKDNTKDLELIKWVDSKLLDDSADLGTSKATAAIKKQGGSALNRAMNKQAVKRGSKVDDDAPETAEEEAELARGMAAAQNSQNLSGRIPDSALSKFYK